MLDIFGFASACVEEFTRLELELKENDVITYSEFVAYFMECLVSSNQAIEQEHYENKIENKVEENSLLGKETIAQGDTNISKFAEEHPKNEDARNNNNKNTKSDNAESPRKDTDSTLGNSQQSGIYSTVKLQQDTDGDEMLKLQEELNNQNY